jgi:hypothetical protein
MGKHRVPPRHIIKLQLKVHNKLLNKAKIILVRLLGNWGRHPRRVAAMQVWLVNIMGKHRVPPRHIIKLQLKVHNKPYLVRNLIKLALLWRHWLVRKA